jgi:phage terminase small subunit
MSTLTKRQSRFVELFLQGPDGVRLVATQAARAAGYAWPAKQGLRLLTFPHVLAAVEAGLERLAVHVGKSREK